MTATQHPHQFKEPQPSATPHERRKFVVLVCFGFVVVLLIWIWTLPFNFRKSEDGPAGPRQFFNVLGDQVGTTLRAYQDASTEDATAATDATVETSGGATNSSTDAQPIAPSIPTNE